MTGQNMQNMEQFKPWDIWLANVKFEDINQSKIRPVVILEVSKNIIKAIKLTSKLPRYKRDYALKFWEDAGLKKPTTAKTEKFIPLHVKKTIFKIGTLHSFDKTKIENLILEKNEKTNFKKD